MYVCMICAILWMNRMTQYTYKYKRRGTVQHVIEIILSHPHYFIELKLSINDGMRLDDSWYALCTCIVLPCLVSYFIALHCLVLYWSHDIWEWISRYRKGHAAFIRFVLMWFDVMWVLRFVAMACHDMTWQRTCTSTVTTMYTLYHMYLII